MDNVITTTTSNPVSTVRMREVVFQALSSLQPEDMNFRTLYKFLTNKVFRIEYKYTDYEFKSWWDDLFNSRKTDYKKRSDFDLTMSSVASRLHQALRNKRTKVFIEGENRLDIEKLVQNGESLIINIKSSNDLVKVFIANLFVGAILSYMSLEKKIKPLFVYIDEFDLVASGLFAESLQLGRSSLVGFTLAHQNFSSAKSETHKRMMEAVIDSIFSAVSNYQVFNTSPKVSKTMCDVFNLSMPDFTELNKYESQVRLETKNSLIITKKPVLTDVSNDYIFPSQKHSDESALFFLDDEWIMI